MELDLIPNNNVEIKKENNQQNFLNSTIGKAIDNGIDIGLRIILPDYIEEQIINVKDNLLEYGLKEGIKKSINSAIDFGKNIVGIATGNFENMSQMQNAIKNGGIIDSISELMDEVLNKVQNQGKINKNITKLIRNGKDALLDSIENNIETTINTQVEDSQKLDKYMNNWKEYYEAHDIKGMEKEYKNIKRTLDTLMPIETTIKNARTIELLHNLILNNGNNFEITQEEKELIEKISL